MSRLWRGEETRNLRSRPERPSLSMEKMFTNPMDDQLRKVEKLLDSGASLDMAKVEVAKLFVQEMDHESSRNLIDAGKAEVQSNTSSKLTSAAAAAISGMRNDRVPVDRSLPPARSSLFPRAENVNDLLICPDEDFRLQVSVTRRSLQIIFNAVRALVDDFLYNDLLMLIWYLSSNERTLEEVASVFELPDSDKVLQKLIDVSVQLLCLQKNAKMDLPRTEFEEDDIVECFERRTGVPKVLGALGAFKIDCLDGTDFYVLSVCDHLHYFRHLSIYTDFATVEEVIRNSPIYERLTQEHPKKYYYACPWNGYPTLPQLLPCLGKDEFFFLDEIPEFELRHNQVVNYTRTSVREVLTRFSKLKKLESPIPEIITAAFMLHNFCIDTRDSSINYDAFDTLFNK